MENICNTQTSLESTVRSFAREIKADIDVRACDFGNYTALSFLNPIGQQVIYLKREKSKFQEPSEWCIVGNTGLRRALDSPENSYLLASKVHITQDFTTQKASFCESKLVQEPELLAYLFEGKFPQTAYQESA
jgi:hypothetical protein